MSKATEVETLQAEDLGEWEDAKLKVIGAINKNSEQYQTAMRSDLTISDNFDGSIIELDFTAPSYPSFQSKTKRQVKGLLLCYIKDTTTGNDTYPSGVSYPVWSNDRGKITIENISGLTVGNKYKVRFLILGD